MLRNYVNGVRMTDISAHGFECQADNVTLRDNYVEDCDRYAMSLRDMAGVIAKGNRNQGLL